MSDQFAESVFNRAHRVLGLRLRPFTFWHAWQLDFAGINPRAAASMDAADLVYAVWICSRRPGAPGSLPRCPWWLRSLLTRRCARRFLAARVGFAAYIADHDAPPKTWENDSGRPVKSPWFLYCVSVLVRHGRMTFRQAWATEVGYGRHLQAALAEAGGADVPLISPAEAKAMKEAGH